MVQKWGLRKQPLCLLYYIFLNLLTVLMLASGHRYSAAMSRAVKTVTRTPNVAVFEVCAYRDFMGHMKNIRFCLYIKRQ